MDELKQQFLLIGGRADGKMIELPYRTRITKVVTNSSPFRRGELTNDSQVYVRHVFTHTLKAKWESFFFWEGMIEAERKAYVDALWGQLIYETQMELHEIAYENMQRAKHGGR